MAELRKKGKYQWKEKNFYIRTFFAFAQEKLPITLVEVQKERVFVPYYAWGDEFGR